MIDKIRKTMADIESGKIKPNVSGPFDGTYFCCLPARKLPLEVVSFFPGVFYPFSDPSFIGSGFTIEQARKSMIEDMWTRLEISIPLEYMLPKRKQLPPSTVDYVRKERKGNKASILREIKIAAVFGAAGIFASYFADWLFW